jgi:hypothetical protein
MSITRPQIQESAILPSDARAEDLLVQDLRLQEIEDLVFGRGVVEPDRAFISRILAVICNFGAVEAVPAGAIALVMLFH